MSTFTLPVIGRFEFQPDAGGRFEAALDLRGRRVTLDINVYGTVTQHLLDSLAGFVANLADFDQSAREYLSHDFEQNNESSVRLYIEHHLETIVPHDLRASLDPKSSTPGSFFQEFTYAASDCTRTTRIHVPCLITQLASG